MASLVNKTLCIVGGTGYVGQGIARAAVKKGINVIAVSRTGDFTCPELVQLQSQNPSQLQVVRGDANNPETFKNALQNSDAVVHSMGTLVDSSVLKGRNPGEVGTYEHLNRDCLINVASYIKQQNLNKKIVFLSGSMPPPFLPRYLTTKEEAEDYLLDNKLATTILKPGFIHSKKHRVWSIPLSYEVDFWAKYYSCFYYNCVPENTFMKGFMKNLLVDRSVDLECVANAAVYSAFNRDLDSQKLWNAEIEKNSMYYDLGIQRTEAEVQANAQAVQRLQKEEQQRQQQLEQQKKQQEQEQQKQQQQQEKQQQQQQQQKQNKEKAE